MNDFASSEAWTVGSKGQQTSHPYNSTVENQSLTFFNVFDNFLQQWQTGQKTNLQLFGIGDAILLRADEVKQNLTGAVQLVKLLQPHVVFDFALGVICFVPTSEEVEVRLRWVMLQCWRSNDITVDCLKVIRLTTQANTLSHARHLILGSRRRRRLNTLMRLAEFSSGFLALGAMKSAVAMRLALKLGNHSLGWSEHPLQELPVVQSVEFHGVVQLADLTGINALSIHELVEQLLPAFLKKLGVFASAPACLDSRCLCDLRRRHTVKGLVATFHGIGVLNLTWRSGAVRRKQFSKIAVHNAAMELHQLDDIADDEEGLRRAVSRPGELLGSLVTLAQQALQLFLDLVHFVFRSVAVIK
jgi:hypothetical protein